jgi:hypothetical protein
VDLLVYLHAVGLVVFTAWMLWVFLKREWAENYARKG